jgi:hypothetical protein
MPWPLAVKRGLACPPPHTDTQLRKLEQDLEVVADRVRLCREMLPLSPGIGQDAALAEVVGFLEACRPRLVR